MSKCLWIQEDDEISEYATACGHNFYFTDDAIPDNGVKYCMFCGKKIEVRNPTDEEGE